MRLTYWAPHVGHVGTIKAVINSARSFRLYGEDEVTIIRNHSEWEQDEEKIRASGIVIEDFGLRKLFPNINRTGHFRARLYNLLVSVSGIFSLRKYVKEKHPDVVIANLVVVPVVVALMLVSRKDRPRLVISIQGFPKFLQNHGPNYPGWMRVEDGIRRVLWNLLYNQADIIVSMTETTRHKLLCNTKLDEKKLTVINNPIVDSDMLDASCDRVEEDWWLEEGTIPILGIGRLTEQKDFNTLIRATKIVRERYPVRLLILGDGEQEEELKDLIRELRVEDYVKLYGFSENPYAFLSRASLFVLSSRWEDPGHVLLEAAALKTPIVSTDCPSGPADLLENGKGGELCAVADPEDMAEKIIFALEKDRDVAVERAYQSAQRYSLEAHYSSFSRVL